MGHKCRKTKQFSWFRLCIFLMTGYFCYVFVSQQAELYQVRRETVNASARLAEVVEVNNSLMTEKEKLRTAPYIEKVAREELGLVKPGEVPYIPAR